MEFRQVQNYSYFARFFLPVKMLKIIRPDSPGVSYYNTSFFNPVWIKALCWNLSKTNRTSSIISNEVSSDIISSQNGVKNFILLPSFPKIHMVYFLPGVLLWCRLVVVGFVQAVLVRRPPLEFQLTFVAPLT